MKSLRKVIFWMHLALGLSVGLVVFLMAVTGLLMSFEPQIMRVAGTWAYPIEASSQDQRLGLDELVGKARAGEASAPTAIILRSDPSLPVTVAFGREKALQLHPYTGQIFGPGTEKLHDAFHFVEDLHRWLALKGDNRDRGRAVTGAACLAFLLLICSGLYLWWPRSWSAKAWRGGTVPGFKLKGKARDWNWHNSFGFWMALPLIIITLTGLIMSYSWANNLLFRLAGSEPPPPRQAGGGGPPPAAIVPAQMDRFLAVAAAQVPDWVSVQLRFPTKKDGPVTAVIEERTFLPRRSNLILDFNHTSVIKWEPFSGQALGKQLRTWVRPIHTGEAWGLPGQILAALAAGAAGLLVWTGFALSWRRFFTRQVPGDTPSGGSNSG